MSDTVIKFENVGKLYRLGTVGTGTLSHDLRRWWITSVLRREDPYLRIGETNDRASKGHSDYVYALRDISFEVHQGDVVGIIGKNGAGKSTLLKLLSRVTAPTTGKIYIKGRIASLLEVGTGFHPELTGRENIYLNGSILGMKRYEIDRKLDEIVDFSGCERYIDTPVKRYSSGMTVRLGFAIAAHLDPEILVVDEVLAVGDAEFQKKAIGKMKDVSHSEGRTVLFVSHNMDSILNLCTKGILLQNGMIAYSGNVKETVDTYLCDDISQSSFLQEESNSKIFINSVTFNGSSSNQQGIINLDEPISFNVTLRKEHGFRVDPKTVISIMLETSKGTRITTFEEPLLNFTDDTVTFRYTYPPNTLIPNNYHIRIGLHIPFVQLFEVKETCSFTILDDGSDFIKYKGAPIGYFFYTPKSEII